MVRLSAEQVRALQIGERVSIEKENPDERRRIECTVAGLGKQKFLTYRVKGALIRCEIREYAGWTYSKGGLST